MPQMSPINWMMLFIVFVFTLMMFNLMNYYLFNLIMPKSNLKMNIFKSSLNWKW